LIQKSLAGSPETLFYRQLALSNNCNCKQLHVAQSTTGFRCPHSSSRCTCSSEHGKAGAGCIDHTYTFDVEDHSEFTAQALLLDLPAMAPRTILKLAVACGLVAASRAFLFGQSTELPQAGTPAYMNFGPYGIVTSTGQLYSPLPAPDGLKLQMTITAPARTPSTPPRSFPL
jgi:hypothetical protein